LILPRSIPLALVFAAALLVSTGCVSVASEPGDWRDAVGREWVLTKLHGKATLKNNRPTLTLADDARVVGHGGANRFFGTYHATPEGSLRFAALGSTQMFRPDPPQTMQQERRYLEALGQVESYRVTPRRLVMLAGKTKLLVFAHPPQQPKQAPTPE